ncbi:UDP-glycosyltransferase 71K1-like protein [Cinnamomum micranthum f. kanehirae]|uniref:UDP-glycosyltransferase 71K1-like protein n=1 Tax=Cinnamomum micranthum f. kanehirae TaxID=337451 RepID=A0A3S3N775_9MAGN|nr:UDP-glycosyltransferase 71K1-like protein [Cinnamomum micranthum f. kanehirae]
MEKRPREGRGDKIDMEELRLVFLPIPVVGHLKSTVELAKRLLEKQPCFSIRVLLMHLPVRSKESTIESYVQSVAASNPRIHFVHLPLIDFQPENNQGAEAFISLFVEKHESHVKEALKTTPSNSSSPPTRVSALIMDFFSTTIIHVGKELGIPTYLFFTAGAATLGLMLHLPTLHVKIPCEFKDFQGEVEVPGMLPLPATAMPEPVMNKKKDGYEWFLYHGRRFREADGLIVNTFAELEPTVIKSVRTYKQLYQPQNDNVSLRKESKGKEGRIEKTEMAETGLVFLPQPSVGHLMSTVEFAKSLLEKQPCLSITVLLMHLYIPSDESVTTTVTPHHESHAKEALKRMLSSSSPPKRVSAFVIDFFAMTMIDVGKELGIPTYAYCTSGAIFLALLLYLPTLHVKVPCEFKDLQGEVEVPGMLPLPPLVMPDPMMNKKSDGYDWFEYQGGRLRETDGLIIANGECLPDYHPTPPVYPVGPLLALNKKLHDPETSQLMEWLDQQPHSSVVFLCFGSVGSFSVPQLKEMALGLERSGHHFLWALRCRSSTDTNLKEILPDGFLDRTKGRGLVLQSWAPQVDILAHAAVGGFVSHCGWNSSLESIWFGVPMLAWPLYAEQKLNAFQLVRDYGLAVELSLDYEKDGWVSAEELEKGVRCLMGESEEGQKVRKRAEEMAEASKKALAQGGSSFSTLELLAEKFML